MTVCRFEPNTVANFVRISEKLEVEERDNVFIESQVDLYVRVNTVDGSEEAVKEVNGMIPQEK